VHIGPDGLQPKATELFTAFGFEFLVAAEFDARAARGFGARETGALEIVGAPLYVRANLLIQFALKLRAMEESGSKVTKRGEESHSSSGCAASAEGPLQ
jgi:hypothetical protein